MVDPTMKKKIVRGAIGSLKDLPNGQLTTPQMRQAQDFFTRQGFAKDKQDFMDAYNNAPTKRKNFLVDEVHDAATMDSNAGWFGKLRRQNEVVNTLKTPLLDVQTPFNIKNNLSGQGTFGINEADPMKRNILRKKVRNISGALIN